MRWVLGLLGLFVYGAIKTGIAMTGDNLGALPSLIIFAVCMLPAWVVGRWIKQDQRDAAQKAQRQRDREEENNLR